MLRVAKLRGDAGLAIELLGFGGSELAFARDLDGDGAVKLVVARLPDRAERADANLFDEIEVGDRSNGVSDFGFADRADEAESAAARAANDVFDIHFALGLDCDCDNAGSGCETSAAGLGRLSRDQGER